MSSRPLVRKSPVSSTLRIVSLAPSVTSILLSLGVRSELVGVSKWCRHVARIGNRPTVGDCWKLNIEEVTRLRPTHVIGSVPFAAKTVETILKQPFQFLALTPRTLADIEMDIFTLGRLVGREDQADILVRKMRISFRELAPASRKSGSGSPPVRVYAEAWPKPRISSPPWVAELISMVGGEMCVPPGARVTDEQVAAAAPEMIVLAWTAAGDRSRISSALKNPRWQDVPAVMNRRVFVVRDEWLNTPGPPLVRGARALRLFIQHEGSG